MGSKWKMQGVRRKEVGRQLQAQFCLLHNSASCTILSPSQFLEGWSSAMTFIKCTSPEGFRKNAQAARAPPWKMGSWESYFLSRKDHFSACNLTLHYSSQLPLPPSLVRLFKGSLLMLCEIQAPSKLRESPLGLPCSPTPNPRQVSCPSHLIPLSQLSSPICLGEGFSFWMPTTAPFPENGPGSSISRSDLARLPSGLQCVPGGPLLNRAPPCIWVHAFSVSITSYSLRASMHFCLASSLSESLVSATALGFW